MKYRVGWKSFSASESPYLAVDSKAGGSQLGEAYGGEAGGCSHRPAGCHVVTASLKLNDG